MRKINLGEVYLPEEIITAVERHKQDTLEAHKGTELYNKLQTADFSMWFGDYLFKYGYKLLDEE